MHSRVAESARTELDRQIRRINEAGYKAMNPIVETVGIIRLEQSADPTEKVLGHVMGALDRLSTDVKTVQTGLQKVQAVQNATANATANGLLGLAARSPRTSIGVVPNTVEVAGLGSRLGLLSDPFAVDPFELNPLTVQPSNPKETKPKSK